MYEPNASPPLNHLLFFLVGCGESASKNSYKGSSSIKCISSTQFNSSKFKDKIWSKHTLLGEEQAEATLQRNSLPRPLVVGGEARGVRRLGDLAVGHLLESV